MFVRLATAVLRQLGDQQADQKAEAIAVQMDFWATMMGGEPSPVPALHPASPPPPLPGGFPAPNPAALAAVAPEPEPPPITDWNDQRTTEYAPPAPAPAADPPLVTLETRIPDRAEVQRVTLAPPAAPRRQAAVVMKVEDLNLLIQQRTPETLTFDVPMEDGKLQRVSFTRNVISMHAHDSVQLIYYPPGAGLSAREATEVMAVLHVAEPVDLSQVLKDLAVKAADGIRPRGAPREVPVRPFSGAVATSAGYSDGLSAAPSAADMGNVGGQMSTGADVRPSGYVPPEMPSSYHPGQSIPPSSVR
jgi:hypothetical protein